MPTIRAIYRYPVKGLSPEPLQGRMALAPGETVPDDRLYAIENGPSGFDAAAPAYLSKQHFLMLMKNERLARLRTSFDHTTHILSINSAESSAGGQLARGDLRTSEGRAGIEQFFAAFCADELRGAPKILRAQGHSFSDVAKKVVSIINVASVAEIATMVGAPVDPLRFRANVYVDGWAAWSELDLVGKEITISPPAGRGSEHGSLRHASVGLKVVKRIVRCAATNVDPSTGLRDLEVPQAIMTKFGHADCGIYAEVTRAGEIAAGDEVAIR